ncbi:Peptidase C39 family protein [Methanobrevibacter olleyae]|uniref:Peptidase C39 family protein n=1 Tax=Methanobrevibacter olleyae TaxID=294671 RepID=A0A1I4IBD9_METOL|nr:cysteine peptidase family C39 domain-containing protein [Methanobrevibacter olleyae]SFL51343.1 Peptidase C39 family protein [Methanobrevibacter olleyae]
MLKINKKILIICIISLFLIMGQVAASDTNSTEFNDINTNVDSIELDQINKDTGNFDRNLIDKYLNDEDDELNQIPRDDLKSNDNEQFEEINDSKQEDNIDDLVDDVEIIEEKEKDTTGIVIANDNFSCGPASLATVLNKFGLNLSLNELSKHTNTSSHGTTMQSLIDATKYYNFSAYGVEIETKSLKENYIVNLNLNGCEHWSVVRKVTDTHVFLADSTEGNINFTIDEFNSYFNKKAIVLSNDKSIDLKEELIRNQISILDKDQCLSISGKGLKKKVIGYKVVWKYGFIRKYGWVLRPVVKGGHVSFSKWQYVKGYYTVWGKYKTLEPIYKYYYVSDEALTSAKIKKN